MPSLCSVCQALLAFSTLNIKQRWKRLVEQACGIFQSLSKMEPITNKQYLKSSLPHILTVLKPCSKFLWNCHTGWLTVSERELFQTWIKVEDRDEFTHSDEIPNISSLVWLIRYKSLCWDSLLSMVQELLPPQKPVGSKFRGWNKYIVKLRRFSSWCWKRYQLLRLM